MRSSFILSGILLSAAISPTFAATLSPADRAWIATCVEQRKASKDDVRKIRGYCTCMHEIIEDNQPFENITALERTYPPVHQQCWKRHRLRPG